MKQSFSMSEQNTNIMRKTLRTIAVFGFFLLCFAQAPQSLFAAANLSLVPANATVTEGDRVTLRVSVSSASSINAISGSVLFPPSLFSIESVSKSGSILNFWVTEPSFSKTAGTVSFEGVSLSGFQGSSGTVLTINARALKTGSGTVSLRSGQVLANDGQGTNVTGTLGTATITIKAAVSKPEPEKPAPTDEIPTPEVIASAPLSPGISLGMKYGVPAVLGTSIEPGTQVLLSFIARGGSKVFITATPDADGSFYALIPDVLKRGTYTITANAVRIADNMASAASDELTVYIGPFSADFNWGMREAEITLFILIFLILFYFLIRKMHHKKEKHGITNPLQ